MDAFKGEPEVFARAPGEFFFDSFDGTRSLVVAQSIDWSEQANDSIDEERLHVV